jgi:hypothetical protein
MEIKFSWGLQFSWVEHLDKKSEGCVFQLLFVHLLTHYQIQVCI